MKPSFSLSIPKPCSENWNSFTPTSTGGFCGSCQKNVIDFTKATDEEIVAFISKIPEHSRQNGSPGQACGRFRSDQLKTYIILPEAKIHPGLMLLKTGIISLLFLLVSKPSSGQAPDNKPKTEIVEHKQHNTNDPGAQSEFLVRGILTSAEDGTTLPGVSVVQRNTSNGTQTDGDGRFQLTLDLTKGNIITFSFIGLETVDYKVTKDHDIKIVMKTEHVVFSRIIITGEVSENKPYVEKKRFFRSAWSKIKNIF